MIITVEINNKKEILLLETEISLWDLAERYKYNGDAIFLYNKK